jgi:predicted glycoside hydrolase/deacetylase ChbG (UPF0249 family)
MKIALALAALVSVVAAAPRQQSVQERLGFPPDARLLIIHADDLGMSHAVNRATFDALEHGWGTSASILVPCPWFPEVAAWARAHPDADLGVHLALNSEWTSLRWGPISGRDSVPSLLDKDGYLPLLEREVVAHAQPADVERELRAQIDMATRAGVHLTHLDSHMATLFQTQPLFEIYRKMGTTYGLPVLYERLGARGGAQSWSRQAASDALIDRVVSMNPGVPPSGWFDAYRTMLGSLPPGVYQLIVHLGYDLDEMRAATSDHPDWGAAWRQSDYETVKSDAFRALLREKGFTLIGWRDLGKARK